MEPPSIDKNYLCGSSRPLWRFSKSDRGPSEDFLAAERRKREVAAREARRLREQEDADRRLALRLQREDEREDELAMRRHRAPSSGHRAPSTRRPTTTLGRQQAAAAGAEKRLRDIKRMQQQVARTSSQVVGASVLLCEWYCGCIERS